MRKFFFLIILYTFIPIYGTTQSYWVSLNAPVSFSSYTPIYHPNNPSQRLLFGDFGIYQTFDDGISWQKNQRYSDPNESWIISTAAYSPNQNGLLFVGPTLLTEHFGFDRSTDNGETWQRIHTTDTHFGTRQFLPINGNDSTLLMVDPGRFFKSSDQGLNWCIIPGLDSIYNAMRIYNIDADADTLLAMSYISANNPLTPFSMSVDGGETWNPRNTGLDPLHGAADVAFHPDFPGIWYGRMAAPFGTDLTGVYKSTNFGEIWFRTDEGIPAEVRLREIAMDPRDPDHVFVSVYYYGMYETTDGGQSWHPYPTFPLATYPIDIKYSPHDPNTLWVTDAYHGLYVSTDRGQTWAEETFGLCNMSVDFMTGDGENLYLGSDMGRIYHSTPDLTEMEMITTDFPWAEIRFVTSNPFNSNTLYFGGYDWYQDSRTPQLFVSHDRGQTWRSDLAGVDEGYIPAILEISPVDSTWMYLFTYNLQDTHSLKRLYYKVDPDMEWTAVENDPPVRFKSLAIDPVNPGRIWAGEYYEPGHVWQSTDGGYSWIEHADFDLRQRTRVIVDPQDGNRVYAHGERNGMRTTDGGQTWQLMTLAFDEITGFLVHPTQSNFVFIGFEEKGLFFSDNYGETWQSLNEDPYRWHVTSLYIDAEANLLYAGFAHSGLYQYDLSLLGLENDPVALNEVQLFQNYPNPFNPMTTIPYQLVNPGLVKLGVYNSAGQLVKTLINGQLSFGTHEVTWDGRNEAGQTVGSGIYFYRLKTDNGFADVKSMILLK